MFQSESRDSETMNSSKPIGRIPEAVMMIFAIVVLSLFVWSIAAWFFQRPSESTLEQLSNASQAIVTLVLIAMSTGFTAMATVQFWKALFKPRALFHEAQLNDCLGASEAHQLLALAASGFVGKVDQNKSESKSAKRYREKNLGQLDLLNSPSELLMAQLGSAAEFAMLRPGKYKSLLLALVGPAGHGFVDQYAEGENKNNSSTREDRANEDPAVDALYEVRFFVEQNLDLLLVRLRNRWRARVRIVAAGVSAVIGLGVIVMMPVSPFLKLSTVSAAFVWGGFFAWFSRDLVSLAERHRN